MYKTLCLQGISLTLVSLSICLSSSGMLAFVGLSVCSRKDRIRYRNDPFLECHSGPMVKVHIR